jgi:hypothetical protein
MLHWIQPLELQGWLAWLWPALFQTVLLLAAVPPPGPRPVEEVVAPPASYVSYRAMGPIRIDGKLDEPDWQHAPQSSAFVDIVTGKPAWYDTRVSILWDDKYLYFGIRAEERDVRATLTEHDSPIYNDNDLEIFIAGKDAYYEFEINALNTVYDVFWIWQDMYFDGSPYKIPEWDLKGRRIMVLDGVGGHVHPRGKRNGYIDYDFPGLLHAVHVDGTLNHGGDVDRGWTAEVAFPWEGLKWLADGRSLPPHDGDVWRIDCSRFEQFGRDGKPLDPPAGWTWNRHGYYDSHIPETFPYVRFSNRSVAR